MQIELCDALDGIMDVNQPKSWIPGIDLLNGLLQNYNDNNFKTRNEGYINMINKQGTYKFGAAEPPIPEAAWKGLLRTCKLSK